MLVLHIHQYDVDDDGWSRLLINLRFFSSYDYGIAERKVHTTLHRINYSTISLNYDINSDSIKNSQHE